MSAMKTDLDSIVCALRSGEVKACARVISYIEDGKPDLVPLMQALYKVGGRSRTVGITGPPGAGKSSLVNKLIGEWRQRGKRVAVLAIDPSSPFSGGALLGDRLRMTEHYRDDGVFIRSMAARGHVGGLAKAAGDALTVLDAMPWDIVITETVGVGQSETDIMRHTSTVVLLQTPMGGDDIQAAKAGINEIGDIYVVNKSDHPDAGRTALQLEQMISLNHQLRPGQTWRPPVVKTQSLTGAGVGDLVEHIERRFTHLEEYPDDARRRLRVGMRHRTVGILRELLDHRLTTNDGDLLEAQIDTMLNRESDPYAVAIGLLNKLFPGQP